MSSQNIIISQIVTEKVTKMEKDNVYGFNVSLGSNKNSIKLALKTLYGAVADKVAIVRRPRKARRAGKMRKTIYDSAFKIAYVSFSKPLGKVISPKV